MSRYVFKICEERAWRDGTILRGSADDRRDGFIHLSTAEQVPGTLAKWFAERRDLVLLRIEAAALGDRLRWEPSRDGAIFPHFYGELEAAQLTLAGRMADRGGAGLPEAWRLELEGALRS